MGVSHSMDDSQVQRVTTALQSSANAIQGINGKFDMVDAHWQQMQEFNDRISTKVDGTLNSFRRLDETLTGHADLALDAVVAATDGLTQVLEETLQVMNRFDMRREMDRMPKVIMPLAIPLIILLIELAVANAYLGILLSSLPNIRVKYSNYLLVNAGAILLGLTLSLVWLGMYRALLAYKTRQRCPGLGKGQQRERPRASAGVPQSPGQQMLAGRRSPAPAETDPAGEPPETHVEGLSPLVANWEVLPPMQRTFSAPACVQERGGALNAELLRRPAAAEDHRLPSPRAGSSHRSPSADSSPPDLPSPSSSQEVVAAGPRIAVAADSRPQHHAPGGRRGTTSCSLETPLSLKVHWSPGGAKAQPTESDADGVTL
mmetsp:Transcript_121143/g.353998  ORF Transcript_121143/g.353998 Transcript_121143/m.353998 type:complete len:374 (-) Transcript_121143:130-1251(-)